MYGVEDDRFLTDRELDVLVCLHKGLSNPKIADYLCITVYTVKAHLSNIFRKLGAKNRMEALLMLVGEKEIKNNDIKNQIKSLKNLNKTSSEHFKIN